MKEANFLILELMNSFLFLLYKIKSIELFFFNFENKAALYWLTFN
jgi:hypothetical protein